MYEHFEPSDRVFIDREEYLQWMEEALTKCKEKTVVLHLRGIGGIGKSSLLDYWSNTIESTIRLDCEQYSGFYDRLNVLAKGAVIQGVQLQRFDVLWQIRQRFVVGVEPVKETGREWAKEVVMAIPFIGSLANIGSAISAVGAKVTPKLKKRYGIIADWLKTRLGKNHVERFLEIIWKEPRNAEFLFMDALLEDINNRKNLDNPILFLLDHFEYVDSEAERWGYKGRQIAETELWSVFLSLLSCCVGVMAGRKAAKENQFTDIEESELTELDRESCYELLELLNLKDTELQDRIVSVSGGNPFVIGAICDIAKSKELTARDVENLRASDLEEVRLKTWRRLFSQVQDLQHIINRAALLPFFDRQLLNIVVPTLTTDQWERLLRLSFVRTIDNEKWVLHDIVEDLVKAELGDRILAVTEEIAALIESNGKSQKDFTLLGLSFSIIAEVSPNRALEELHIVGFDYGNEFSSRVLEMYNAFRTYTEEGIVEVDSMRGWLLFLMGRVAEAEDILTNVLEKAETLVAKESRNTSRSLAMVQFPVGILYAHQGNSIMAEKMYNESIMNFRKHHEEAKNQGCRMTPATHIWYVHTQWYFADFLRDQHRLAEAEENYQLALKLIEAFPPVSTSSAYSREAMINYNILMHSFVQRRVGKLLGVEETLSLSRGTFSDPYMRAVANRELGWTLFLNGDVETAEELILKGLGEFEKYHSDDPQLAWFSFVTCLIRMGVLLRLTGLYSKAEEVIRRALNLSRKNTEQIEDAPFSHRLPWSLAELAIILRKTGRIKEAEEIYHESLELSRGIVNRLEDSWRDKRAWTLNNYAVLLSKCERKQEAEKYYLDAIAISRDLADKYPESIFLTDLYSTILNNLGVLYRQTKKMKESKKSQVKALELRRELAEKSPELYQHRVATSLNNLGVLLAENSKLTDAELHIKESIDLRRELVEKTPEVYEPDLASVLNNLGILMKLNKRYEEAEEAYREAIEIYELLFSKAPEVFQQELVRTRGNLILLLSELDKPDADIVKKQLSAETPSREVWSEEEEEDFDKFTEELM